MSTLTLAGGELLNYTTTSWATSPEAAYAAWAAELGVSSTETLQALNADDQGFALTLAASFFSGGSNTALFSSEGGVGFYRAAPASTVSMTYLLSGVNAFQGIQTRPTLLLTFHPPWDEQSFGTKVQHAGTTTIVYAQFSDYASTSAYTSQVALRIGPGSLELVANGGTDGHDWRLFELAETTSASASNTTVLQNVLAASVPAGQIWRLTAALSVSVPPIDGWWSGSAALGSPAVLAGVQALARTAIPTMLGSAQWLVSSSQGRAAAPGLLGADWLLSGTVDQAGAARAVSPLLAPDAPQLRARVQIDAAQLVALGYSMALWSNGVALARVPISSWQASYRIGQTGDLSCAVPACAPWLDAIEAADEVVIYRLGRSLWGESVAIEMARAPIVSLAFNQTTRDFSCSISGTLPAWVAPASADGDGEPRALAGVRSVSFGSGGSRVRAAVDWFLRPGEPVLAAGQAFVVGSITVTVPGGGDAYMDVGEWTA